MKITAIITIIILAGCTRSDQDSKYLRWVGDAEFDPEIDASDFQLCGSEKLVQQYFYFGQGLQYEGEKTALRKRFKEAYVPVETAQSGWIRIRFIVNCQGQAGRYRMIGSDLDYEEQTFDERITDQLLKITKSLDGWTVLSKGGKPRDYYQYLIFKINNGDLTDILP
jgi:hypothetical protein